MSTINLLLGKYDREKFNSEDISTLAMNWEGDAIGNIQYDLICKPITLAKIFSRYTERDEIQVVGKLYKGVVDDEIEGPTLVKKNNIIKREKEDNYE